MKFVRESLQGIEESSASFRTQPDIIADVDSYEPQELLSELFHLVAGYVSSVSSWLIDSVQSLAINVCPYRPIIGAGSFIETPKSLCHKGVVNIQNEHNDYCLLWSVLAHINRVYSNKHPNKLFHYRHYFNDLNIIDLQFPLKHTDVLKFEKINPSISVNVLMFENKEVFPLYASKHRDRPHHINVLMISNNEGKFHYLLVRDLSKLVACRIEHTNQTFVCPYFLYYFSRDCLLDAHLPECSIHPEQKVIYSSPDNSEENIKKFKAIAKTLPVPFVLYAEFEAFLVPVEENKESASNTKVRQLYKLSVFACIRVSQVPEFNGEILSTAIKII